MVVLSCAIGLGASGCGGGGASKGVKVTGSVTQGGKAVEGVKVGFISPDPAKAPSKAAMTDAEGQYQLTVVPGKYTVTLIRYLDKSGKVPKESENPAEDFTQLEASGYLRQVLPVKYVDPDTSPFKVDIPPEGKALAPFTVE